MRGAHLSPTNVISRICRRPVRLPDTLAIQNPLIINIARMKLSAAFMHEGERKKDILIIVTVYGYINNDSSVILMPGKSCVTSSPFVEVVLIKSNGCN